MFINEDFHNINSKNLLSYEDALEEFYRLLTSVNNEPFTQKLVYDLSDSLHSLAQSMRYLR